MEESQSPRIRSVISVFYYCCSIAVGCILVTITGIGASLRSCVGLPVIASAIQFATGTFFTGLVSLPGPKPVIVERGENGKYWFSHWTTYAGGACGAIYVTGSIVLAPINGYALHFVFVITGQLFASLLLDHTGFLGLPQSKIKPFSLIAIFVAICGSAMTIVERVEGSGNALVTIGFCLCSLVAGSILPLQVT